MKAGQKRLIVVAFIFVVAILNVAVFSLLTKEKKKDAKEEKTAPTTLQPSGYTVTVSEEAQKTAGITIMALKPGFYQKKVTAYGTVLAPEGLSELFKNYTAATSGLERAKAQLKASETEYERLKVLNASNKNVSDKDLQSAAARFKADQAEDAAASGTLLSAKNDISLKWGPILSRWVFGYKPALKRIIETKDVLVQITVPPSLAFESIPKRVRITAPTGASVHATFVSRATSTNPALQGLSFIYIASSRNGGLVPGMNVTAQMPTAMMQAGFFIPASAVVWLQDKAWVYVKKSETGFSRLEIPTTTSVNSGYFVPGIFAPGEQVVIKGAQALLSAESTPKTTGGGGDEDEGDDD